jgi:hypothetical protein
MIDSTIYYIMQFSYLILLGMIVHVFYAYLSLKK